MSEIKKLEGIINKYIEENNVSPFTDIKFVNDETGEIEVEMDTKFEKIIDEEFENPSKVMGDYFTQVIKEIVETMEKEGKPEDV